MWIALTALIFFLYKNAERLSFELRLNVFISFEDFNLRNVLKTFLNMSNIIVSIGSVYIRYYPFAQTKPEV